jgi:hypothetical protein
MLPSVAAPRAATVQQEVEDRQDGTRTLAIVNHKSLSMDTDLFQGD